MNVINRFNLCFSARSTNETFARAAVATFAAQLDPTLEEINDIKTAVSEAVTNCIVHAYARQTGKVYITCSIRDTNELCVTVRDKGCGIENVNQAMEPLFTTVGGERAGLGFAVMQSFMDRLRVRSTPGKGTTVTMVKKIQPRYGIGG